MLDNWWQVISRLSLMQMEKAADAGKLVSGIEEARKAARSSNSRLVIVETDPVDLKSAGETFYKEDPIDEIVEKVLENGGDVDKLSKPSLGKYGPVALIKYY